MTVEIPAVEVDALGTLVDLLINVDRLDMGIVDELVAAEHYLFRASHVLPRRADVADPFGEQKMLTRLWRRGRTFSRSATECR